MSTFTRIKKQIKSAKMNGTSTLAPLNCYNPHHMSGNTGLEEREELYVGYGYVPTSFPYPQQDMYTRELYDTEIETIVLENEFLKATFYPEFGGKLASLIDKTTGKDLLFCNPVVRPGNLAIRNAWMSGGVEWNCGFMGHHPHTCDTYFCAKTQLEDGTPVLRMYEYERVRRAVVQMDFFLPDGSRMLYARMRVTNTTPDVIPMYWWSNIAVREDADSRVITMAKGSYVADNGVSVIPLPVNNGVEVTYPVNTPTSMDYFYKIPQKARKFECYMNTEGYGFVECSTSRLKGRKLFVWGQGAGGIRWQEYLSGEGDDGRYVELQAGLACTQYESLPMPPNTTWEWLEGYGALSGDAEKLHGCWEGAQNEALRALDEIITEDAMDEMLDATYGMATSPAGEVFIKGSGWAALENMRRAKTGERLMAKHLDFGTVGEDQDAWAALLECDSMPEYDPTQTVRSYMYQPEWTKMLEKAASGADRYNWYTCMQLGFIYIIEKRIKEAKELLERSYSLRPSAWALHGLTQVAFEEDRPRDAALLAIRAAQMCPTDISLAKNASAYATQLGMYRAAREYFETITDEVKQNSRVKLNMLFAYIRMKMIDEAEAILWADGGIEPADVREGENLLTELYIELQGLKAERDGVEFDRGAVEVPAKFDYRMGVPKERDRYTGRAGDAQRRADAGQA